MNGEMISGLGIMLSNIDFLKAIYISNVDEKDDMVEYTIIIDYITSSCEAKRQYPKSERYKIYEEMKDLQIALKTRRQTSSIKSTNDSNSDSYPIGLEETVTPSSTN